MTVKEWTKDEIKELLQRNDTAVLRGLFAIYRLQTVDEQEYGETHSKNGIGFNGIDAPILSSFVEFYKKHSYLSEKQMNITRKKILKYAGQLTKIANGTV